jgi:hemerythrin
MTSGAYDVLSEHQHIRRQVDALELALAKRGQGGRTWLDETAPLLDELARGLVSHFKGEEAEFFADVSKRLPRHSETVQRLADQHQTLSKDFETVANQVVSLDPQKSDTVEQFADRLSRALKQLRIHEEQENELMLCAYWQDLGEAD